MVIEVVVTPASCVGVALGILYRHIGAIPLSGKIAPARRLGLRTIGVFRRSQRELQLFEKNCPFGKDVRLLVFLVGARINVDIVIFREAGLTTV